MKRKSFDGYPLHKLPTKRERVFKRDGYKCLNCGIDFDLTIDHIKPKSKGGKNTMRNLQTLCETCNRLKSDREIDYRK